MNILVAGAGPAGLYFSYLAKRQHPDWQIRVVEQNPADSTFGFGVVFSDRALEFLRDDDAETYERITPQMEMDRPGGRAPRRPGAHRRHRLRRDRPAEIPAASPEAACKRRHPSGIHENTQFE